MYSVLADALLLPHLFFILWVIFRAAFVRRRCAGFTLPPSWGHAHRTPALDLPANLGRKLAEDESRTSTVTGQILAVLSPRACLPNISRGLLTVVGVVICLFNSGLYVFPFRHRLWVGRVLSVLR